jgi:uncharacterized protein
LKILIGIQHPKHVHLFKNIIYCLIEDHHDLKIVAVDKEVTGELLEKMHIPFTRLGTNQPSLRKKIVSLFSLEYQTFKIMKDFQPDLVIGRASPHLAHISALLHIPFIIFEDTEVAGTIHKITVPFASSIVTPSCFLGDFGKKHVRYKGFDELSYLHPNFFTPNPQILTDLGLNRGERYIVLRFISWHAHHDRGQHGIRDKIGLIKSLENYGRIIIISEGDLPIEFKSYAIKISPEKIHDLLSYATLYMGEGGTMASEAAILGTPSIFISTLASKLGNFITLEKTYDLLYSFTDDNAALEKAVEILLNKKSKENWITKRELMLNDTIDVTEFMINFIENYPIGYSSEE